jgi:hypothetical protein
MALPNINMQINQQVTVTAVPEDGNGNPGSTQPNIPPTWSFPTGITGTVAANGLSAVINSGTTPGVYTVEVTDQPVAFGSTFTSSFTVTVAEQPATQMVFNFGTPGPIPAS